VFRKRYAVAFLVLGGCFANTASQPQAPDPEPEPQPQPQPQPQPPPPPQPPAASIVASNKARLTFKGGDRYARALSTALGIPREELCKELSVYDCTSEVHAIALGGVEPYRNGIYEPLPDTAVTTPIAVERVALSACARRARVDFADPANALIFRGEDQINKLYQRLLSRPAEPSEIQHLRDLHEEMKAIGHPSLDEKWAEVACFAVATSLEALFY
jgi:hypothetical protein